MPSRDWRDLLEPYEEVNKEESRLISVLSFFSLALKGESSCIVSVLLVLCTFTLSSLL